MLEECVMIFAVTFVTVYLTASFIGAVTGKIGRGVRVGGEEDQPDPHSENPPPGSTEALLNDYLNRRP